MGTVSAVSQLVGTAENGPTAHEALIMVLFSSSAIFRLAKRYHQNEHRRRQCSGGEHKTTSAVGPVAGSTGRRGWDGRRRGSGISARLLVAVATYEKQGATDPRRRVRYSGLLLVRWPPWGIWRFGWAVLFRSVGGGEGQHRRCHVSGVGGRWGGALPCCVVCPEPQAADSKLAPVGNG